MPIVAGVLFVLTGVGCIAYAAAAADAFPADPFAAIGALLVGLGLGSPAARASPGGSPWAAWVRCS